MIHRGASEKYGAHFLEAKAALSAPGSRTGLPEIPEANFLETNRKRWPCCGRSRQYATNLNELLFPDPWTHLLEMAANRARSFFRPYTNPDLADILGETDFDVEN